MRISLCIIAKHGASSFRQLIDAAAGHVDEILVGIDDGTENGIEGYRSEIVAYHRRKLGEDYAAQRNFLAEKVTGDWCLTLDTDETLSAETWCKLRELATSAIAPIVCFVRHNIIEGCVQDLSYPDWQTRLYRRDLRWTGNLHEAIGAGVDRELAPENFAVIHAKTQETHHAAIKRYIGLQGIKQGILIFERNRPNYLQICLDAIDRCDGKEAWPVILSVDGGEHLRSFEALFTRVRHVVPWRERVGNLWHVTRSLRFAFEAGLERVLFMDGDCILRTDTLRDLPLERNGCLFCGLTQGDSGEGESSWFTPTGNLLWREDALPLLAWVEAKEWVGKKRPGRAEAMKADYPGYDGVYCRYLIEHELKCRYRARSYIGHIGVCGQDCNVPALEAEIFAGPSETWLWNAVALFGKGHDVLSPKDFTYA